jgi:hypothetical protein
MRPVARLQRLRGAVICGPVIAWQVNGDNNVVGWFHSTSLRGGFCDLKSVETHFMFEKRIKNAIYLVYDPVVSAATGSVALKARL